MIRQILLPGSLLLLLLSCTATNAVCPRDTTADLDVTITQLTPQPMTASPVATIEAARAVPRPGEYPVKVQYAVVVANRTGQSMMLEQISLETPYLVGYRPEVECFGVEVLGPAFETTTVGVGQPIAPGGERRVVMLVDEPPRASVLDPPVNAMTARIRVSTGNGTRSETLTRRVIPYSDTAPSRSGAHESESL